MVYICYVEFSVHLSSYSVEIMSAAASADASEDATADAAASIILHLKKHGFELFRAHISRIHYLLNSNGFYNEKNSSKHCFILNFSV